MPSIEPHRSAAPLRLTGARPAALALALALALVAAACGTPAESTPQAGGGGAVAVRAVTTTTVLGDLVRQVGGDRVQVTSLVPKGGEVHTFDPSPSDVRRVAEADVVFLNGLGLDEWLADLVADAGTGAPVVELGEDLEGVEYLAGGHDDEEAPEDGAEGEADAHGDEPVNPHLWLDASYAARYADRIGEALAAADPDGASGHAARAEAYAGELRALHEEAGRALAAIPEANRTVIAFHDAFPYFARAYGLRIDDTIVDAPGQDPSAGQVAQLIRVVRERNIRAIFAEAQFSDALVRTIADETGARVVSSLYTDSTGDPPQDTYLGMMRWNVERVMEALGQP